MRRVTTALALCASLSPLVLCASTEGAATLQRPQAVAFARAVNLRSADVPGFSVSSAHDREITADRRLERALRDCVTAKRSQKTLAEVSSSGFEREAATYEQSVSSEVSVAQAPTWPAARQSTELRSSRVRGCLSRDLNKLLAVQKNPPVVKLGPVSIALLPTHAPGASSSFGLRISARIKVRIFVVHVYVDVLGFVHNSAVVTLVTSGAPAPFPASTERHLFSLLLERAKRDRL